MSESIIADFRFYVELYVNEGLFQEEAERLARDLMLKMGIDIDGAMQ